MEQGERRKGKNCMKIGDMPENFIFWGEVFLLCHFANVNVCGLIFFFVLNVMGNFIPIYWICIKKFLLFVIL